VFFNLERFSKEQESKEMPYFSGDATIIGRSVRKVLVTDSNINSSAIDMNHAHITSVKDPIHGQDAATKWYVDNKVDKVHTDLEKASSGFGITLKGTGFTEVQHMKPGSYLVTITNPLDGYPTATFSISKAGAYVGGSVMRITGSSGLGTGEQLDMQWPKGGMLLLRKTGPSYDGEYLVAMNHPNVSNTAAPPIIPTDAATKAYVDEAVRRHLEVNFGGVLVSLSGGTTSPVTENLKSGSYVVTVTAVNMDGAPTATFSVSKNSLKTDASIQIISSKAGIYTPDTLELSWPADSLMLLKKIGPGYDGTYLVDMNLKNFSSNPVIPSIPTDAATVAFVTNEIQEKMQERFGGIVVNLEDSTYKGVRPLRPGSYLLAVTSFVPGGACATFAISKTSQYSEADITRTSRSSALETFEDIELAWPENSMVAIRKTAPFHDGEYLVDFNLKNFTIEGAIPVLPSDTATKDYVDLQISQRMQMRFGGVTVLLSGTQWAPVAAQKPGSYTVNIVAEKDGAPTASFHISKSSSSAAAHVVRMTSSSGKDTGEKLELEWPEGSKILLRKTGVFHDGKFLVDFNVKNFEITQEPIMPSDSATKVYVDEKVRQEMTAKFSGVQISLIDTEFATVVPLKVGSYFITVSPLFSGGYTGCFSISKGNEYDSSVGTCLSSSPAEMLEVVWPENSQLLVRKKSPYKDGSYLVDFNLKNFSNTHPPVIPSDVATLASVEKMVLSHMKEEFYGILVHLSGEEYAPIGEVQPGSYVITVTSQVPDGPTATFLVSKSGNNATAQITCGTSSAEEGSSLQLVWPENEKMQLRKTGTLYDGDYLVDFNLKNFSTVSSPLVASDVATKSYVDARIKKDLSSASSTGTLSTGVQLFLEGTEWVHIGDFKAGSYVLAVSGYSGSSSEGPLEGAPTGTFAISKTRQSAEGSSNTITAVEGDVTGEKLELAWPSNGKMMIRKTGGNYNGLYRVDTTLRNMLIYSDNNGEEKDHVTGQVSHVFQYTFNMMENETCQVAFLPDGSYFIFLAQLDGDVSTSFSINKYGNTGKVIQTGLSFKDKDAQEFTMTVTWRQDGCIEVASTDIPSSTWMMKIV
jgi:hypothetical protein